MKQAIDYAYEVNRFAGWNTSHNLPGYCRTTYSYRDTAMPAGAGQPEESPPVPVFTVWAFKLTDGKWVKNDKYSWDSSKWPRNDGRVVALDLVKRINAVPGWRGHDQRPGLRHPREPAIRLRRLRGRFASLRTTAAATATTDRGLSETNGGWSGTASECRVTPRRRRIHDNIYAGEHAELQSEHGRLQQPDAVHKRPMKKRTEINRDTLAVCYRPTTMTYTCKRGANQVQ